MGEDIQTMLNNVLISFINCLIILLYVICMAGRLVAQSCFLFCFICCTINSSFEMSSVHMESTLSILNELQHVIVQTDIFHRSFFFPLEDLCPLTKKHLIHIAGRCTLNPVSTALIACLYLGSSNFQSLFSHPLGQFGTQSILCSLLRSLYCKHPQAMRLCVVEPRQCTVQELPCISKSLHKCLKGWFTDMTQKIKKHIPTF